MTICLITSNPHETAEQYEQVMTHLQESGPVPPQGARLLIAGRGPSGWRAVSVWDDPQSLERFFRGRLTAAYHSASVAPEATTQETFQIHTLIVPELAAGKRSAPDWPAPAQLPIHDDVERAPASRREPTV